MNDTDQSNQCRYEHIMAPTTVDGTEGLLAIIIYSNGSVPVPSQHKITFLTEPSQTMQLAHMLRPEGSKVDPHVHYNAPRKIIGTQEVLFIRQGKLRIDFYTSQRDQVASRVLESGDVVLLIKGGHGMEMLEDVELVEIKQGPYLGAQDKLYFKDFHGEVAK